MSIITINNIKNIEESLGGSVILRRRVNNGNTVPRYRLEEKLVIELSNKLIITVPKNFEWDLSSSPRILWSVFPPDGLWELASLIHDYLYINKIGTQKFADDEMLLWSKAVSGTNNKWSLRNFDNQLRYVAVRLFGWIVYNKRRK